MTTDSVFILIKNTDFITILSCLRGEVYPVVRDHKIFVAEIGGGHNFIDVAFCKFETPFPKKITSP